MGLRGGGQNSSHIPHTFLIHFSYISHTTASHSASFCLTYKVLSLMHVVNAQVHAFRSCYIPAWDFERIPDEPALFRFWIYSCLQHYCVLSQAGILCFRKI